MAHKFNCGHCGAEIIVKWLNPGDPAKCRSCGETMKVPDNAAHVPDDYAPAPDAAPGPAPAAAGRAEGCAGCRWLERAETWDDEGLGFCHRYPPEPRERYPEVAKSDWCGEYAPK